MTSLTRIHRAHVSDAGALVFEQPVQVEHDLRRHAGKAVEVLMRRVRVQRSTPQNKWYFGVILTMIGEYCGYEREEAHQAMKWLFLRRPADVVGAPDTVRSTASLSTVEFSEYCEQVRRFAATDLGLNIPDPGQVEVA